MEKLEKTIIQNGIHYTLIGDYYFPTCTLQNDKPAIGQWAARYEQYLREVCPSEYTRLIWANQLTETLERIQAECSTRAKEFIHQIADAEGVTEELKSENQMEWARLMNNIRNRAEEIILAELLNK